jgi:hypothetical protein
VQRPAMQAMAYLPEHRGPRRPSGRGAVRALQPQRALRPASVGINRHLQHNAAGGPRRRRRTVARPSRRAPDAPSTSRTPRTSNSPLVRAGIEPRGSRGPTLPARITAGTLSRRGTRSVSVAVTPALAKERDRAAARYRCRPLVGTPRCERARADCANCYARCLVA